MPLNNCIEFTWSKVVEVEDQGQLSSITYCIVVHGTRLEEPHNTAAKNLCLSNGSLAPLMKTKVAN